MINLDTNRYYSLPTSPTQHTCASVWVSVHASERAREREMGGRRRGGDEGGWGRGGGGGCVCMCVCVCVSVCVGGRFPEPSNRQKQRKTLQIYGLFSEVTATRHRRRASCVFFCGHKNVMITRCCHTQRQYKPPRSMRCGARGLGTVTSINTSPNCQLRAGESPHVLHLVYFKLPQWTLSIFRPFRKTTL